ncbi:metallophosphoesterase [Microbacterium phage Pumpernickel]|uniref:Metallophosphoesterase n=1 Tax=Microbacterium phage Pumpernickel TaxID=2885983 RepID=A0AAE8Y7A1_9CAUD|nr:metallophosphoesterase [Microbacterium phage Pumpernickel]UDL15965.1 metallophosphoesterase [Microbacterium phage Pumpernickel]
MDTTQIGLIGDLHGNTGWAKFVIKALASMGITTALQVGDFGLYRDKRGAEFQDVVSGIARKFGMTIYVVPGNHENWDYINETIGDATDWVNFRTNILVAPRVHRWEWNGVSFASLSGAPSVDRQWRVQADAFDLREGRTRVDNRFYETEVYTVEDVAKIAEGGYADVMVGHDAPHGIRRIESAIQGNPFGFASADLAYAEQSRQLYTQAFEAVAPRSLFHGHYHVAVDEHIARPGAEGETTHIIGLNCDTDNYSFGVFDTATQTATLIDDAELLKKHRNGTLI